MYHQKTLDPTVDVTILRDTPACDSPVDFMLRFSRMCSHVFHLNLGNVCNMSCRYCCLDHSHQYYATPESVADTIRKAARWNFRKCALVGGEPTIRRDLLHTMQLLTASGINEITLTTNGLMLSYPKVVASLVNAGMRTVHLSIDDFDPETTVWLSRNPRCGELVFKALVNLMGTPGVETFLYGVVTRANVAHMNNYVDSVAALKPISHKPTVIFSGMKPAGSTSEDMDRIFLPLSESAAAIRAAIDRGREVGVGVGFKNIPNCLMPGYEGYNLDAYLIESEFNLITGAYGGSVGSDRQKNGKTCGRCRWNEPCTGVFSEYTRKMGWDEFESGGVRT